MVTVVPVIQELSSETKKSTSLAISSGAPNLFNNVVLFAFSTAVSGFSKAWADSHNRGVSTGPGQMAFTLIFGA